MYIAKQIFEIMNLQYHYIEFDCLKKLDTFEISIYSSVKKALGLRYTVDIFRKCSKNYWPGVQFDIEEYLKQYINGIL